MEKFLVTIEFRYNDSPKYEGESSQYISKKITIGVFDTRDEANTEGNKSLEVFEKYFKLNPHYNKKERFSNNGGSFGSPRYLISNVTWIQSPFAVYVKITKLKYDDVEESIIEAINATKRYRKYKESHQED